MLDALHLAAEYSRWRVGFVSSDPTLVPQWPRYTVTISRRSIKGPAVPTPNPPALLECAR